MQKLYRDRFFYMIAFFMFEIMCEYSSDSAIKIRESHRMPAVIYGGGNAAKKISINMPEFIKFLETNGPMGVFNLKSPDTEYRVILQDVQRGSNHKYPLSADFIDVNLSKKFKIWLPVVTEGKPVGVQQGGLLRMIHKYLPVIVNQETVNLLSEININIEHLRMNQKVSTSELSLPHNIKIYRPQKYSQILKVVSVSKA